MSKDIGLWEYNEDNGLYYFKGLGVGRTLAEVEKFEDDVEIHHIIKNRREF